MLSRCYYHPRSNSIVTDRQILDSSAVKGLLNLLPEEERYGLKYVTVCLEGGLAGEVDRDSFVTALEVFGQIRDSGVNPLDILRELKERTDKIAPVVKARALGPTGDSVTGDLAAPRRPGTRSPRKRRAAVVETHGAS
jgi:hypothetical protein